MRNTTSRNRDLVQEHPAKHKTTLQVMGGLLSVAVNQWSYFSEFMVPNLKKRKSQKLEFRPPAITAIEL